MEKQAVVREGITPSVESGKKSSFVNNGNAFCKGEKDTITVATDKLEKAMEAMYTGDK
jgi:subtilase family serine protease